MRHTNVRVLATLIALLWSGWAYANPDLHHKVTAMLLDHLDRQDAGIQALRQDRGIAKEDVQRAIHANDLTLSGILGGSTNHSNERDRDSSKTSQHFNQDLTAQLNLRKTLLDWGRLKSRVVSTEIALQMREQTIRQQTEDTYLAALDAYYSTLRSMARVRLRKKNLGTLQSKHQETTQRLAAGIDNATSLAVAEASLALGVSNLAVEQANLEAILNTLEVYAPKDFEHYLPEEVSLPPPNTAIENLPLEHALEEQQRHSPSITAAHHDIRQAEAELKTLLKFNDPTLGLNVTLSHLHGNGNRHARDTDASAGISLTIPIIGGGSIDSDIRRGQQKLKKKRLLYRATLDQQAANLKRAWSKFHALKSSLKANQQNIRARENLLARAKRAFEVGQLSATQVLDEEDKLLEAQLQIIDTQYQRLLKAYQVTNLIGWTLRKYL